MTTKTRYRSLILFGVSAVAAVLSYVVFPGCTTGPDSQATPAVPESEQHRSYASALGLLQKMKGRGELPGVAAADAGVFSGTWLWYDHAHSNGDHRILFTFTFVDGRRPKRFEMVYYGGWQLVPLSKH